MLTQINVNNYVVVQLTAEGEEHLRKHIESLVGQLSANMLEMLMQASVYSEGHRRFQLHDLMHIFGPEMGVGSRQMFVENKLHIA